MIFLIPKKKTLWFNRITLFNIRLTRELPIGLSADFCFTQRLKSRILTGVANGIVVFFHITEKKNIIWNFYLLSIVIKINWLLSTKARIASESGVTYNV